MGWCKGDHSKGHTDRRRAIILKGTRIGEGSVIAAGTVVLGNIPPYSVYISKHKIIPRFSEEELYEHLRLMRGQ